MLAILAVAQYNRLLFLQNKIISDAAGNDFLVLEVLFERNAARHDGGELHVIHRATAGIRSKILFTTFFAAQPMPAAKPVRVAASMMVLTSLLSDMTAVDMSKNKSLK